MGTLLKSGLRLLTEEELAQEEQKSRGGLPFVGEVNPIIANPLPANIPAADGKYTFKNGLSIDLSEDINKELGKTNQTDYPEARELINNTIPAFSTRFITQSPEVFKAVFASDPRDKISAISDIVAKDGATLGNVRTENDQILFDVTPKDGQTFKTYTLNRKGFSPTDVEDFVTEGMKYLPAMKGAMLARGAATGVAGAGRAIMGATATQGAMRGTEDIVMSPTNQRPEIEGYNVQSIQDKTRQGFIEGATGEGAFQVLRPVATYIKGIALKVFNNKPNYYSEALKPIGNDPVTGKEIYDEDKIAAVLNTAIDDPKLSQVVRDQLKAIKEGTPEGQKFLDNLIAQQQTTLSTEIPLAVGQVLGNVEGTGVQKQLKNIVADPNLNTKIKLLFSEQDAAFQKQLKTVAEYFQLNRSPKDTQLLKQDFGNAAVNADNLEPIYSDVSKSVGNDISSISDTIFKEIPETIEETFKKMDIIVPKGTSANFIKQAIAENYIVKNIIERMGRKITPETSGKEAFENVIADQKLAVAGKYAPNTLAKISKFAEMQDKMLRSRTPEQIKASGGIVDLANSAFNPYGLSNWAKVIKALKTFTPEDAKVTMDLLTSKISEPSLTNALVKLQKINNPEEYMAGLKDLVKRASVYNTVDKYNPITD